MGLGQRDYHRSDQRAENSSTRAANPDRRSACDGRGSDQAACTGEPTLSKLVTNALESTGAPLSHPNPDSIRAAGGSVWGHLAGVFLYYPVVRIPLGDGLDVGVDVPGLDDEAVGR